jgi:xanthine dehydrogenase large subunit
MLAISVFCAVINALSSLRAGMMPPLNAPATPEAIMRAVRLMTGGGVAA